MSQDSVLKYIKKHPGVTSRKIVDGLGLSSSSVCNSLKILREHGEVRSSQKISHDVFEGFVYFPR